MAHFYVFACIALASWQQFSTASQYDAAVQAGLNEALLQEMLNQLSEAEAAENQDNEVRNLPYIPSRSGDRFRKEGQLTFLSGPSIRDQEYLQHSSLWGNQYVAGGAGEGYQRLKPDGSSHNTQQVKTDAVLPAYCNPPNPCPIGYTAEDGCLEDFENSATFSRQYQSSQECMCDSEHMFDCPGATQEEEVNTLARSIQNEGLMDSTIDRIVNRIGDDNQVPPEGEHKSVAKKFFQTKRSSKQNRTLEKAENPFLSGEKLPVVAKKG